MLCGSVANCTNIFSGSGSRGNVESGTFILNDQYSSSIWHDENFKSLNLIKKDNDLLW